MPIPDKFLDRKNRIAVVGVSGNPEKWGRRVYEKLKSAGFTVYPLNPRYKKIGNDTCYPDLSSLPEKPDVVMTVVPPDVTEKIAEECKKLGIKRIWMQPGSESGRAVAFCRKNNIKTVTNTCFIVDVLEKR